MFERRPWDKWYKTARWQNRRKMQLKQFPLCEMCSDEGQIIPATVVDHVVPHKGDEKIFWFGKLRSLCQQHHSGLKQRLESGKPVITVGVDGWPKDETEELRNRWMDETGEFRS